MRYDQRFGQVDYLENFVAVATWLKPGGLRPKQAPGASRPGPGWKRGEDSDTHSRGVALEAA